MCLHGVSVNYLVGLCFIHRMTQSISLMNIFKSVAYLDHNIIRFINFPNWECLSYAPLT